MYKCAHFDIAELVPRHVFVERGWKAWELLDDRALFTLDSLRQSFGPITVNDWKWGGSNQWRGLRTPQSPYGTMYSMHRFGCAFDCIFAERSAQEVRDAIMDNPYAFPHIRALEEGTSWLHFETSNRRGDEIFLFRP